MFARSFLSWMNRFPFIWDKYIAKAVGYGVPERARRWYVRHVEGFIKAHSERRLATLSADDVVKYLKEKDRSRNLVGWQFRQIVDALRILFVDLVRPDWAQGFDWAGWSRCAQSAGLNRLTAQTFRHHPGIYLPGTVPE